MNILRLHYELKTFRISIHYTIKSKNLLRRVFVFMSKINFLIKHINNFRHIEDLLLLILKRLNENLVSYMKENSFNSVYNQ